MSELDPVHEASSGWSGWTANRRRPHGRALAALTRRTALTGGAAGIAAAALAACGGRL